MHKTDLDLKEVLELARQGASDEEIAAHFDCRTSTVTHRATKELSRGRKLLAMDIRKAQIDAALGGNYSMLAYLGRELLGQSGKAQENQDPPVQETKTSKLTTKQLAALVEKSK